MKGEGDEAEMMGEEGVGGRAGKAVDGAVTMGLGGGSGGRWMDGGVRVGGHGRRRGRCRQGSR